METSIRRAVVVTCTAVVLVLGLLMTRGQGPPTPDGHDSRWPPAHSVRNEETDCPRPGDSALGIGALTIVGKCRPVPRTWSRSGTSRAGRST